MKSKLVIAPLKPWEYEDAAKVYRQSHHFLVEISGESPQSIGLELVVKEAAEANEHWAAFVSIRDRENNLMVGLAIYEPSGYQGDPACAWIALLMIAEPFQRLGYGAEACRIIENEILGNPRAQTIKLGVLANNPAALAFWNEMGYRKTGTRECRETGQSIVLMEKQSVIDLRRAPKQV